MIFEHAKIGDGAGELELAVLGGRHGGVDAEEAGREDQEDSNGGGQLPARKREPLEFGLLGGGGIVLLGSDGGALLVSRQPHASVDRQIPRSRHSTAGAADRSGDDDDGEVSDSPSASTIAHLQIIFLF